MLGLGHYSLDLSFLGHDLTQMMPGTFLAVDFFFVLSGFIIAHAYHSRLEHGLGLAAFMRSRLVRLYPLYFIGITIPIFLFIITIFTDNDHQSSKSLGVSYLLHLLFLPTPPPLMPTEGRVFPLDAVAWSLSLEIWINIVYACCCKWLSPTRLLGLISLSAVGLYWSAIHYDTLNIGYNWDTYLGGWFRVFSSFFAGVLLYSCYTRYRFPQVPPWCALVLGVSMVALFTCPENATRFSLISILILCPAIIWLGAHITVAGVSRSIAAWLGKISYAVYITHFVLFFMFKRLYTELGIDPIAHLNANIGLCTAIAVLFAWLLDEVYDMPVRKWLNNRWVRAER
jgi:peptidoglycan/LPS O-acetylase OafA/YrhL